jgi:hypothetical protein
MSECLTILPRLQARFSCTGLCMYVCMYVCMYGGFACMYAFQVCDVVNTDSVIVNDIIGAAIGVKLV